MVVKAVTVHCDIVVVGAGVIGLSTAMLLKKKYMDKRIVVLDKSQLGSGTSLHGGAADVPFAVTEFHRHLIELGRQAWDEHVELQTPGFPLTTYWIAEQDEVSSLHEAIWPNDLHAVEMPDFQGFPIRLRPSQRVYVSRQGRIGSPRLACEKLAAHFRSLPNSSLQEGTWVKRIAALGPRQFAIDTGCGQRIHCRSVVLAAGPWLPQFAELLPEDASIRTKKVIAFHLDYPTFDRAFNVQYLLPDMYFIPDPVQDNRWIFCVKSEELDCLPDQPHLHVSAADRDLAYMLLHEHAPELIPYLQGARVFCDAYHGDAQPYVHRHPEIDGLIFAGAGSGSGYRLAPGIAQMVLAMMSSGPSSLS